MRRAGLVFAGLVFVAMPVGAGASGHSALAMLAFAGLFLLANAVMRPDTVRLDAPGALAVQAVTAAAFAALLVGLGQTLRALARIEGGLDLFGWVFAAAWALLLARIVWPPGMNARAARTAEAALREVHRAGQRARDAAPAHRSPSRRGPDVAPPAESEPAESEPAAAGPEAAPPRAGKAPPEDGESQKAAPGPAPGPSPAPALPPLDALPGAGAGLDDIRAALARLEAEAPAERTFAALQARSGPDRPPRDRRALLVWALDPAFGAGRSGTDAATTAFEAIVAAADTESLADFLALAAALLDADPQARAELPEVARLIEIADQIEATHEDQAEGLISLAHRLEDLALDAENGADA